jgi:hypothetical protein
MGTAMRPSHQVYFFPLNQYLKDLFNHEELRPYLDHTPGVNTPAGSVKRSHGYSDKVLNNPVMSADPRNQPLILSADGVPYFGAASKHSRGAWPIVARLASLPDGLWGRFEFAHLFALEPQEHWCTDIETGRVHRKRQYAYFSDSYYFL